MKAEFYLVVKAKPVEYGALPRPFVLHGPPRCTIKKPSTSSGEIAVQIDLDLPDVLWRTPQIKAKVVVPDEGLSTTVVDAEVLDNVAAELSKQLGLQVRVSVDEGDEE